MEAAQLRRRTAAAVCVALTALGIVSVAAAQDSLGAALGVTRPRETLEQFSARITADLRARSSEAADLFTQAGAATERRDFTTAEADYRRVLELVPGWYHAQRRLCSVLVSLKRRTEGVALCRQAYQTDKGLVNASALVYALAMPVSGDQPKAEEVQEALGLARRIVSDPGADVFVFRSACIAALSGNDAPLLARGVAGLDALAPAELETNYFGMILAEAQGNWSRAEERLRRAEAAGLAPADAAQFREDIERARPWWPRLAKAGLVAGVVWAVAMLLLLATGLVLSRMALRATGRVAATPAGEQVGLARSVRRSYRVVLFLACVLYYLSLPLVVLAVVGGGALAVAGLYALGWLPLKLIAIIVIVAFVTVGAMAKSLFVRPERADPGVRLDSAQHPRLQAVLGAVAGEIGTRTVDNVYLTPGTQLAVMERGGVLKQMRNTAERCLILGVGVLEGLRVGPFKAVLAHEYGHFSNRDTAGGGFALAVRRSIEVMAAGIARGGAAAWYNPAWLFIHAFYRLFLRISQGASRLQEVLADRWAALAYGAAEFERGLRHVIARSVEFEARANAVLKEVVDQKLPLANLYAYAPTQLPASVEIEQAVAAALNAQPSPYDSHPAPAQRLAWVHAISATPTGDLSDGDAEAWSLFTERAAIEARMTEEIRANVQRAHGIAIAAGA